MGTTSSPAAGATPSRRRPRPRSRPGRSGAYDAINEVYFDEIDSLLARIAYFERELSGGSETDLVSANCFPAVREELIEQSR